MKKTYFLSGITIAILIFASMTVISADIAGILETWRNPQTGNEVFVNPYNHDNSVLRGQEYQARILELIADGYIHKNYSITENGAGGGPQFGSYEENCFVETQLEIVREVGIGVFFRTTPEGLEYSVDGVNFLPVPVDMTVPVQIENLDLQGIFNHERYNWTQTGSRPWQGYWSWKDTGEEKNEAMITVVNEDGTEATWVIMDIYGASIAMITVNGEEVWEMKTITYQLPSVGSGPPQLQPKYYGVLVLGTKYGPQSIDEIPPELLEYAKEIDGQLYTYSGSPLDLWIYENIYKPNHTKNLKK